jgi:tRNA-2-methylthio-N6-dimethylallyladenosine synthase
MPDTVDRAEKKRRMQAVSESQERIQASINADLVGSEFDILVDGHARGRFNGRTRGDKLVYITSGNPALGDTVRVKVESSSPWSLEGAIKVVEREKVPVT